MPLMKCTVIQGEELFKPGMNLGKGGVLQRQDWFRSSQLVVAQPWQLFCCYTHSCSPVTKGQYTDSAAYRSCSPVKKGHCSPVKKGQYTNSTAYRSYSPVKMGQYTDSEAHRSCSPVKKGQQTDSAADTLSLKKKCLTILK